MDIDYGKLIEQEGIQSIVLTDIDNEAIKESLSYLKLQSQKIQVSSFDYLGKKSYIDDMQKLVIELNRNEVTKEIAVNKVEEFFDTLLKSMEDESYLDYIGNKFDLCIILPIYTQMLYLQLDDALKKTKGYRFIKGLLLQKMIHIIDCFNRNVVKCINRDGYLFDLSDIIEEALSNQDGSLHNNATLDSRESATIDTMKKIEAYEKTYGVGLGSFGLINICEYLIEHEAYYYEWTFSPKRRFLVKGLLLSRSSNQ